MAMYGRLQDKKEHEQQLCFYPVENLITRQPRRHFRASISPIHWQLRSLVGTGSEGIVFFPTGDGNKQLQRLDTKTLETETVTRLSFSPRCLVAHNGWVCCGGETGEFTAIKVEDRPSRTRPNNSNTQLDIPLGLGSLGMGMGLGLELELGLGPLNTRLPPLDASRQDDPVFPLLPRSRNKPIVASNKKFGRERVNCITMWFPPEQLEPYQYAYETPVAVLANNDHHVTIVGLDSMEALDVVLYPDCVNRAVISPDGRLLVAIGDDPYLYVHERVELFLTSRGSLLSLDTPQFIWRLVRRIHLRSQRPDDGSEHRGSFAACFSNTGTYLAVGTQYGVISVFSTSAILVPDEDPMVTHFPSSRPFVDKGAVREMSFSPGPFDLLAWSEDRGHVGIADVRSGFVARQILHLDAEDTYDHTEITDRGAIDPRLLETRHEPPNQSRSEQRSDSLASSLASTLDLQSSRALDLAAVSIGRLPRWTEPGDRSNTSLTGEPLSEEETQVLGALQDHRRRREQRVSAEQRVAAQQRRAQMSAQPDNTTADAQISRFRDMPGPDPYDPQHDAIRDPLRRARPWAFPNEASSRPRERSASLTRAASEAVSTRDRVRQVLRDAAHREAQRDAQRDDALDRLRRVDAAAETRTRGSNSSTERAPPLWLSSRPPRTRTYTPQSAAAERAESTNNNAASSNGSTSGAAVAAPAAATTTTTTTTAATAPTPATAARERLLARILASSTNLYNNWSDLDALYAMSVTSQSDLRLPDEDATRRDRASFWSHLLRTVSAAEPDPLRRPSLGSYPPAEMPSPDETSGLSWSEDGSILYIGAEDGIYEFRVNIAARKVMPSITMR